MLLVPAGGGDVAQAAERRVADAGELRAALQAARPGDVVVMKNGVWKDVAIEFRAEATARAPVRLRAADPGRRGADRQLAADVPGAAPDRRGTAVPGRGT